MVNSFNKVFLGAAGTDTDTGPSDDQFNRVNFLSHFEGANNGVNNVYDDGSASNHTITRVGVNQGSFSPFSRRDGEFSVDFDGTDDFLTVPDSTDFNIASDAAFTLELWAFYPSFTTQSHFVDNRPANTQGLYLTCSIGGGGTDDGKVKFFTNSDFRIVTASAVPLNSWVHIALVRSSGTTKIYINGTADNNTYSDTQAYVSGDWIIGKRSLSSGSQMGGLFSNYRFVNGTAVYTSNFTPSTSKLTAITNTKLLTCQSNRFVDNSASGHTVTPSGGAAVKAFGPFLTSSVYTIAANGGSASFKSGDSLTVDSSSDFNFGTGNFTWECFVYQTSRSDFQAIMLQDDYETGNSISCWLTGSGQVSIYYEGGSTHFTTTATIALNSWNHLAWVRKGTGTNEFSIYINGTAGVSGAMNTNFDADGIVIGQKANGDYDFIGDISNIRIVKGTAVYTGNFTPPTAPLTAITNTKLLLNMTDGQAIDSAAQNNLTLNGTSTARPKISTSVKKFGDSSFYVPDTAFAISTDGPSFGLGDFTVEMWIYWAGNPGASSTIYSQITSNTDAGTEGPHLYWDSSSRKVIYFANNGGRITSTGAVSNTTWYHLALCRASGSTKMFLDGAQTGSTYSDTINFTGAANIQIGTYRLNGTNVARNNQYYDDLRVSNFARYTSNFTAPSAAFPDKGQ